MMIITLTKNNEFFYVKLNIKIQIHICSLSIKMDQCNK